MLEYAKSLGDKLVVGVDSDEKVKLSKGYGRPYNTLKDRVFVLSSIRHVDEVCEFDSKKELENLIKTVSHDILVVGSYWKGKEVVGSQFAGKVNFFDRVGKYSTTNILDGMK
jgi:D-beta-D-heptose 7-phosphate kinase/D-beta-D-heptose 1-phosphate adenosyltransferase